MSIAFVLNMTHEPVSKDELLPISESYEIFLDVEPDNLTLKEAKIEVESMLVKLVHLEKFDNMANVTIVINPNRNDIAMILFAVSALASIQILPKIWIRQGLKGVYMDISDFVVDGAICLLPDWKKE